MSEAAGIDAGDGPATEELEAAFSTLGFWRKLYLVVLWLGTAFLAWILVAATFEPGFEYTGITLGIAALTVAFSSWTHWAVVRRRVGHITAIAVLNFVPGGNIVGSLIMLSIRRVSVREPEERTLLDP